MHSLISYDKHSSKRDGTAYLCREETDLKGRVWRVMNCWRGFVLLAPRPHRLAVEGHFKTEKAAADAVPLVWELLEGHIKESAKAFCFCLLLAPPLLLPGGFL